MRRLPWWGAGIAAVLIAYALLAAGLGLVWATADLDSCGLSGPAWAVVMGTLLVHSWLGFFAATAPTRTGWRDRTLAFVLGLPVAIGAFATDAWTIGPPVFPTLGYCEDPIRGLPGLVVTGVAAALYAWAGSSARNPSSSSATRSGRSSGRK